MTGVIGRYLMRFFALRLAVIMFAVAAFGLLFDLIDASDDLLKRDANPVVSMFAYGMLRLPSLVREMLPLTALLAGLFAVADLVRHREIVVMWGSGLSSGVLASRVLPLALLLMALQIANDELLVPPTTAVLRDWAVGDFKQARFGIDRNYVWIQSGDDVIRLDADGAQRRELRDLAIFRRAPDGTLLERIDAARGRLTANGIELEEGVRRSVGARTTERFDSLFWRARIDLDAVALMARPASELRYPDLLRVVAAEGYGMRPVHAHRTWLHYRLAGALVPALMLVLPLGFLRSFRRVGGVTPLFLKGLATGFSFQILGGFVLALGEGGFLDPRVAAWGPVSLLALFVLAALARAELPRRRPRAAEAA